MGYRGIYLFEYGYFNKYRALEVAAELKRKQALRERHRRHSF